MLIVIEEAHEFLSAERADKMPVLFQQVARIAKRGRDCERSIDRAYLERLNHAYDDWAARHAPELRFVVVETDGVDEIEKHPIIVKLVQDLERGADLVRPGGRT